MSMYPQFEKCIFCRTKTVWDEYRKNHETNGFEITLGISVLTMLMTRITGMNEEYGNGAFDEFNPIAEIIRENSNVTCYNSDGKRQSDKRYVEYFRNGLAHIHVKPINGNKEVKQIVVCSKNKEDRETGKAYFEWLFDNKSFCHLIDEILCFMVGISLDYIHCERCDNRRKIKCVFSSCESLDKCNNS